MNSCIDSCNLYTTTVSFAQIFSEPFGKGVIPVVTLLAVSYIIKQIKKHESEIEKLAKSNELMEDFEEKWFNKEENHISKR